MTQVNAPWRVVTCATWRSKRSIFQPWRAGREWVLNLECGHVARRLMRYNGLAARPGEFALEQAVPPPVRVRCSQCVEVAAQ